jgi:phage terminase large subunit-like protein
VRRKKAEATRADRNIAWIEAFCRIPEGRDVGKPVVLREWQRDILRGIYGTPTRRFILSVGRKNAKTALAAFLMLLHLVGPEARRNGQLYSAAQSRDQAGLLFGLAAKVVRQSPDLLAAVVIRETAKEMAVPELGTRYKALSADASTAYGLSPVFVVHDELGQVRGPRSELYDALETAVAAQEEPLSIVISTQAATDDDLLSVLIDDALTGQDARTKIAFYTASMDMDPFSEEAVRAANPAFGDFQNATEVMAMAQDARRMPSREAEYRNLVLNQRVETSTPYVARAVWDACAGQPSDEPSEWVAGLDLSAVNDLTAYVRVGWADGVLHVRPRFWLPENGLREKSRTDRVPYDVWAKQGHLETPAGGTVDYDCIAPVILEDIRAGRVSRVAFDRWNWRFFRAALERAGAIEDEIGDGDKTHGIFEPFGQGFQSMSPALRVLDERLLTGRLRHGGHPVLTMCAANAVVKSDPAGNRKLVKLAPNRRIDGMVALAMAVSMAGEPVASVGVSFWEVA